MRFLHFAPLLLAAVAACLPALRPASSAELIALPHGTAALPGDGWRKVAEQEVSNNRGARSRHQVFARVADRRVAMLAFVVASVDKAPDGAGFETYRPCEATTLRRTVRQMTQSGAQDCTYIRAVSSRSLTENLEIFKLAQTELKREDTSLPGGFLLVGYRFADKSTFLNAQYLFNPEGSGLGDAVKGPWTAEGIAEEPRRRAYVDWLQAWSDAWYPTLQSGFSGRLGRGDLSRAEAGLPRFSAPQAAAARAPAAPGGPATGKVSSGSGFVVSTAGHVVTNHHVIDNCRSIRAARPGDRLAEATLLASDSKLDLAVLQLAGGATEIARFRNGATRLGESVVVMGFPLRSILTSDLQVTTGIVSALAGLRNDPTRLQITAPVQPGNSGGPLFDDRGGILGVVVAQIDAMRMAQATGSIPQNINFAVKESTTRGFLDRHRIPWEAEAADAVAKSTADLADRGRRITVAIECRQ